MSKDQSESEATNQNIDQTNIFFLLKLIKMQRIKILIMKQKKDLRKEIQFGNAKLMPEEKMIKE